MRTTWSMLSVGLTVMIAGALPAAAETITIVDDGTATESVEGSTVQETFCRSGTEYRGRYSDKIYAASHYPETNTFNISAIIFHDLQAHIGENRKIVSAKMVLQCTNASGPKPIEVIAYPFTKEWNYEGFRWTARAYVDGKGFLPWNSESGHINREPAPFTNLDTNTYDFAEAHENVTIMAKGLREGTEDNTSLSGGLKAEFDVTGVVKLWLDGTLPNRGLALVAPHAGTYVRFFTSNADDFDPRLIVEVE